MGMTIEEAIEEFEWALANNTIEDVESAFKYISAIHMAIDTIRKYQKIEEIVGNYGFDTSWLCLKKIREVIEDVNNQPTIEAIPKDQYEARLKADMVAMLTEIQLEIEELPTNRTAITDSSGFINSVLEYEPTAKDASMIIQQKINELKAESESKK